MNFELDEAADDEEEEGNDDILPTTWTTYRKYDEFFQLEEKIREFHGNSLRTAGLPDRKAFLSVGAFDLFQDYSDSDYNNDIKVKKKELTSLLLSSSDFHNSGPQSIADGGA